MVRRSKKKNWAKLPDAAGEGGRAEDDSGGASHLADAALFFVDTKGKVGGRQDRKRKRDVVENSKGSSSASTSSSSSSSSSASSAAKSAPKTVGRKRRRRLLKRLEKRGNGVSVKKVSTASAASSSSVASMDIWGDDSAASQSTSSKKKKKKMSGVARSVRETELGIPLPLPLDRPKKKKPSQLAVQNAKVLLRQSKVKDVPHAGQSVNPAPEDHRALLLEAMDFIQEEKKEAETRADRLRAAREADAEEEGQQSAVNTTTTTGEEDDDEEEEPAPAKKPVRAENKLTRKQLKKRERRKAMEAQRQAKQLRKKQNVDLYNVKHIVSELSAKEQELATEHEERQRRRQEKDETFVGRLSKHKFKEDFPDIALSEELPANGSMLHVPVTGSVARHVFKKLERKGKIETRVVQRKTERKYALRTYVQKKWRDRPRDSMSKKDRKLMDKIEARDSKKKRNNQ